MNNSSGSSVFYWRTCESERGLLPVQDVYWGGMVVVPAAMHPVWAYGTSFGKVEAALQAKMKVPLRSVPHLDECDCPICRPAWKVWWEQRRGECADLCAQISGPLGRYKDQQILVAQHYISEADICTSSVATAKALGMKLDRPGIYVSRVPAMDIDVEAFHEVTAEYGGFRHWIYGATYHHYLLANYLPEAGRSTGLQRTHANRWRWWVPRTAVNDVRTVDHDFFQWAPPWGGVQFDLTHWSPSPEPDQWRISGKYAAYRGHEFYVFQDAGRFLVLTARDMALAQILGFKQVGTRLQLQVERDLVDAIYVLEFFAVRRGCLAEIAYETDDSYEIRTKDPTVAEVYGLPYGGQSSDWFGWVFKDEVDEVVRTVKSHLS